MKAYKTMDFTFTRNELTTVQSFFNLLESFGEGEEWEELGKQATDMDGLYVHTQELLDYMKYRLYDNGEE